MLTFQLFEGNIPIYWPKIEKRPTYQIILSLGNCRESVREATMARFSRRRGRGNPSKSKPKVYPEFFKVYLPEHNSQKLLIPPAFMKHLEGEIPEKVILKSPLGKTWEIKLETEEHKVLMTKGWESYVKDSSLEHGEFLVFRYDGNYAFTVKAFGINGCEKDETSRSIHHPVVKVEPEDRPDEVSTEKNTESNNLRFTKVDNGKKHYEMNIPSAFIDECSITRPELKVPQEIILRNQSGFSQSGILLQRQDRRVVLTGGWRQFHEKSQIRHGDEYEFEAILDQMRRIKELILVRVSPKTQKLISRVDWF